MPFLLLGERLRKRLGGARLVRRGSSWSVAHRFLVGDENAFNADAYWLETKTRSTPTRISRSA